MTFNLLFDSGLDGAFAWERRRDLVVEVVRRYKPHILGTQEGKQWQLEFLSERLFSEYVMVAPERVWDNESQYPTLFFRTNDFDLLEAEEFWLSRTPDVHLSKDWDSGFPRMMSRGCFQEKVSGRVFDALVTHLDHVSDEARLEQSRMIGRWMASRSNPCVIMGDFNDRPDSQVHRVLTGEYRGMADTWRSLSKAEGEMSMTRHDSLGNPKKYRMDWILHSPEFEVCEAAILRYNRDGLYPSDHYPYVAELCWFESIKEKQGNP
ncbi:MAG: endonuclease/exonuclease/phosphatase family protein [Syntrophales bacterium]|nr:endonuclease/exonuclease/phosphatase family protein [Syntrophales bacterium]